jgi:hypothetical protein
MDRSDGVTGNWEVKTMTMPWPGVVTVDGDPDALLPKEAEEGWEPFAAMPGDGGHAIVVVLRREVPAPRGGTARAVDDPFGGSPGDLY